MKAPIICKQARYTLVSSTLANEKKDVLKTGDAPVLENSSMAFSFELSPKDSKILIESFNTGTADVSIVFDFTFEGLSDSYEAKLEVNWTKMQQTSQRKIDPDEAPPGFIAVFKSDVVNADLGNICRACDWRIDCNGFEYRCMPYTVVSSRTGRELKRLDSCSVVFKRRSSDA